MTDAARSRNPQELDLLARNTKKIKRNAQGVEGDSLMGDFEDARVEREDKEDRENEGDAGSYGESPKKSFKETLMGKFWIASKDEEDEFGPILVNDNLITISQEGNWPSITLSEKLRASLESKWKDCLIVKLLGRSIGYKTLEERIKRMWSPRDEIELIDLSMGYFMVQFYDASDMHFALEEGPWMIFGHYLTVRKWQPVEYEGLPFDLL